jgi:hypothetical protein
MAADEVQWYKYHELGISVVVRSFSIVFSLTLRSVVMHSSSVYRSFAMFSSAALAIQASSLPIVDLGYVVQQASLNVCILLDSVGTQARPTSHAKVFSELRPCASVELLKHKICGSAD